MTDDPILEFDDDFDDEFDDDFEDDLELDDVRDWIERNVDSFCLTCRFDGAPTIGAFLVELRRLADELARQEAAGWILVTPVENGRGTLVRRAAA